MAQIKNAFLKGKMNQDLDSRIIPNGEYREAINLQISRSESDTVGEFENVLGNTELFDTGGSKKIIGYVTNESENLIYVFATDYNNAAGVRATNSANMGIYRYDVDANNLTTLVSGYFLNFNQSFPIHGANLVQELLFFTDNLNQPRKININKAYADSSHYSNEDQISVAKFYPWDKIKIYQEFATRANGAVNNSPTLVIDDNTSNVLPGDVLVNQERGTTFNAVADITDLITVLGIVDANTLILSKAITVSSGEKLKFLRVTAQNKSDQYLANHTTPSVLANKIDNAAKTITYIQARSLPVPRVGDSVVCTTVGSESKIPAGTTIVGVAANYATLSSWEYVITVSKTMTFAQPNIPVALRIGDNPFYDASWKGDAALLDDKFVRFSYRYQFEDNEYSLMAPFSQPVFIPKHNSEFGAGSKADSEKSTLIGDMDNTYKSTIISWFENNVDNIGLRVPTYYRTPADMQTGLKIKAIDVLYKESDALSVKVLDTVELSSLPQQVGFPNLVSNDLVYGANVSWYYYEYQYKSSKPYKTLPQGQTTRVYDKVPIKALGQELISNRVVYGNYVDKHTGPTSIDYSVSVQEKSAKFNNLVEYPYHTLKHNRTYQVGFILADKFGRQSDVILSSYDNDPTTEGSTVFASYKTRAEAGAGGVEPVFDWIGDALNIRLNTQIGVISNPPSAAGEPGIYSATNPLGWYSYKIVVKQQEQEYYNVYLPGFVSGDPIKTGNSEVEKYSYSILLSDNINKVPRDLQEVGPNDTDFASSEILTIRVNNPTINNSASRPAGFPQTDAPWNNQYYPNFLSQEVLAIGTVRDLEVAAIPFVADAPQGTYGATGTLTNGNNVTPVSIGSIPWGASPGVQPFYNSDLNPFVMKIDTTENGGTPIAANSTVPGQIGAECSANNPGSGAKVITMQPFLSVAETKPVFSRLGLFYETNQVGLISRLNEVINAQFGGAVTTEVTNLDFGENSAPNTQLGSWNDGTQQTTGTNWNFVDGAGAQITTGTITASILKVEDQTGADRTNENLFRLAGPIGGNKEFQIFTNSAAQGSADKYFWYSTNSADPGNSTDIYTFTFTVDYNDGASDYNSTVSGLTATLQNCVPTFGNCSNPAAGSITTGSTTIKTFTGGTNGSVDTTGNPANNTREIIYSLDPSNSQAIQNIFSVSSAGVMTAGVGQLVQNTTYTVVTRLTDVAGNGEHSTCSITFTAGTQHVPRAICNGQTSSFQADCTQSIQYLFLATASNPVGTEVLSSSLTLNGTGLNHATSRLYVGTGTRKVYNVRANAAAGSTTGALTQGVMRLTPTLTVTSGTGSATTYVSLQYRPNASSSWTNATDTAGNTISYNRQLAASNGVPGTVTYDVSAVGEYRIFNDLTTGENCQGGGAANFKVIFGDATYGTSNCNAGPL